MASDNRDGSRKNLIQFPNVKRDGQSFALTAYGNTNKSRERDNSKNIEPDDITFGALYELYLLNYAINHTKTWKELIENYKRYFQTWNNRKCTSIKRRDVQHWVDQLAATRGKHCANRSHDTMRTIFNWGIRKEYIFCANPASQIDRYKTKPRERFVQPGAEFARLAESINAYPNKTLRDFFWMCIFTGARKTNILMMRWEQISFEFETWRIPDTKNGDSHTIALTKDAIKILKGRQPDSKTAWVFPSDRFPDRHLVEPKKAWNRIVANAKIEDLHIHDLRRTMGSFMAIQGVSSTIIGKALGHKSPASTAVYARLTQDPVRNAMEQALDAMSKSYVMPESCDQTAGGSEETESDLQ
ncbi:MAG: site-specific integrase [Candidatus Melainabacteria bacterium]|nr:site-specific integrase [Candidatus Melainabacteria bacterium]